MPTLDTTDTTGTQYYHSTRKEKKKHTWYVNTKANTFHDRSSSALIVKISPSLFLAIFLFSTRLLPLVSSTTTTAYIN